MPVPERQHARRSSERRAPRRGGAAEKLTGRRSSDKVTSARPLHPIDRSPVPPRHERRGALGLSHSEGRHMTSRRNPAREPTGWGMLSAISLLGLHLVVNPAAAGPVSVAPAWPNLLSEAGRRAAAALSKSSPWHLEPDLPDPE